MGWHKGLLSVGTQGALWGKGRVGLWAWSFEKEHCLFSPECNILPVPSEWHCAVAGSAVKEEHVRGNDLWTGNSISQRQDRGHGQDWLSEWKLCADLGDWGWRRTFLLQLTWWLNKAAFQALSLPRKHCAGARLAFLTAMAQRSHFCLVFLAGYPWSPFCLQDYETAEWAHVELSHQLLGQRDFCPLKDNFSGLQE